MGIIQRQSALNTIVSTIGVAFGYVNIVLLFPNFFTASEVGLVRAMTFIAAIYAQSSALGSTQIILKYFPYYKDRENQHQGIFFWSLILSFIGFILFSVLFVLLQPVIVDYFLVKSPLLIEYLYYIIPLAFFTLMFNVIEAYLRSLKKTVVPSIFRELLNRVLISLCIALFAFGFVDFKQFVQLYIGVVLAVFISSILYSVHIKEFFFKPIMSFFHVYKLVELIRYGIYFVFSNTTTMITTYVDSLMIAAMLGLREVGIYTTAYFITSVIMVPGRALYKITYPFVAEYWKSEDLKSMGILYKKVAMNNLIFGLIIFIGIWINIDNIFALVPSEYSEGVWVIFFIGIGRMMDMVTGIN
ncbi:MAG: hypothetical protein COB85_05755, partial [Bacteroidetes bacterium]